MPYYTLSEFAAHARQMREQAGESMAEAGRRITRELRDDSEGAVDRTHVYKAEQGETRYKEVIRDLLRLYDPSAVFEKTSYYRCDKDFSDEVKTST